jgi:pimeloyl-ACP methyl ester carboxylesterase
MPQQTGAKPTVVLVHGAFADGSSWNGVIERLRQHGYTVVAPANPLRGVVPDSAYIASVVSQIDGPVLFRDAFAADLPAEQTALMAATQRPIAAAAFSDASGPPAWKGLPSWAVVAVGDKAAGTDIVRSMARRAGADTVEVEGSHVIMVSQPQAVTDHLVKAAQAVAGSRQ